MLRFNKKGDFNLPVGNVDFNQNTYDALIDYFKVVREKEIQWENKDFRDFLDNITYEEKDLVYLDPPYLITFSEYNKLWNEDLEKTLLYKLDELEKSKTRFAVSNVTHYRGRVNELFLEWSAKYNSYPVKSNYISFKIILRKHLKKS